MSTYHSVMATPSKRSSKPVITGPAATLPKTVAPLKPFLRFYHSADLRTRTLAVLASIEKSAQPARHRDELANIVVELAHAGMDYYFIKPLERANVGFLVQTSASVGVTGGLQVIGTVIRNIIGRMDQRQLLSVCGSIRGLMR